MPSAADRILASRQAAKSSGAGQKKGGGLFSSITGHLPGLGGVTAVKELAMGLQAIPTIAASALPGGKKSMLPQLGRGLASSVLGTVATGTKYFGVPGTEFNVADKIIEPFGEKVLGEEYKPKDFMEKARERGLIPALVEDIGNVAIVGGLAKAPLTASMKAAQLGEGAARGALTAAETAGDAGRIAEAARTVESAAAKTARATRAQGVAEVAAHPYRSFAHGFGDTARAARAKIMPPVAEIAAKGDTASSAANARTAMKINDAAAATEEAADLNQAYEAFAPKETTPQAASDFGALLAEAQGPVKTAATAVLDDSPLAQAAREAADAAPVRTNEQLLEAYRDEPTVALYRGENPANLTNQGEAGEVGRSFTDDPSAAQNYAGEGGTVKTVLVPKSVAEAAQRGNIGDIEKGITGKQYLLEPEWSDVAKEVEGQKLPKTQGDEFAQNDYRAAETAAQRELGVDAKTLGEERLLARLGPPNQKAINLVERLPDSVNRVIAKLAVPITKSQVRKLARDYSRYVEVSQRLARSSEGVVAATSAAENILQSFPGMDRFDVSRMVGEEIGKRLDGTAFYDEAIKASSDPNDTVAIALRDHATRGMGGITDEVREIIKQDPEQHAALEQALQEATEGFKVDAHQRLQTLLASRRGAEGLEAAVLGSEDPIMTPSQVKRYRRAQKDLRRQSVAMKRAVDAQAKTTADINRAGLQVERATAEETKAREVWGEQKRAQARNSRPVPKGLLNEEATIMEIIDSTVKDGGVTYDIGEGARVVANADSGHVVSISPNALFDIPLEEFIANGMGVLHGVLNDPKVRPFWDGDDVRLGTWTYADETGQMRVSGDLSISTWHGKKLERWQAEQVARAFGQKAYGDLAKYAVGENGDISMPELTPQQQTIAGIYMKDILNGTNKQGQATNPIARVYKQLNDAVKDSPQLTLADADAQMHAWQTWDYGLSRTHPETYKQGDFFKTFDVAPGKQLPRGEAYLGQTVLGMTTDNAVEAALLNLDMKQVSESLAWYYDSHDYVEQMWRGKTVKLLNGTERDAAEVFYDLLAVTSVMASPKQNLGRALMGFANLEEYYSQQRNAMAAAKKLMKQLDSIEPGTVNVADIGLPSERLTESGTPIAQKFFDSPEVRAITNQTSMTTAPKYNVFDILSGKLNLKDATNSELGQLPASWTGKPKSISSRNVPREAVIETARRLGLDEGEVARYTEWHDRMSELENTDLSARRHQPITAAMNEDQGTSSFGAAEKLSPEEFDKLADEGVKKLERWRANGTGTEGMDGNWDTLVDDAYNSVQEEWGGATINAATGEHVASDADAYSVTVRPKTVKKSISIPIGSSRQKFVVAMNKARKDFAETLDMRFGHLGVFRNETTGMIEFDPTVVLESQGETRQIGAATKAGGGAYHFQSGDGYWIPYVDDAYETKASLARAKKATKEEGQALVDSSPALSQAVDTATMEYQGSTALAKLRSFRDNLSNPHESTAVTLDSVMASIYGYPSTDWAAAGKYAEHADQIRDMAAKLSERFGREVKPHEVQALLWVYAKTEIGQQDWARFLGHVQHGHDQIDGVADMIAAGDTSGVRTLDPMSEYRDEEMGYGTQVTEDRARLKDLRATQKAGNLLPEEADELAELADLEANGMMSPRRIIEENGRKHIPSTKLGAKATQFANWDKVNAEIKQLLLDGDVDSAHKVLDQYSNGMRKAIEGDTGGSFQVVGEETRASVGDSAALAEQRLREGKHVPAPREWDGGTPTADELFQRFGDKVRGAVSFPSNKSNRLIMRLFEGANLDTLMHESGHLLRQILPNEDIPRLRSRYRGLLNKTHVGREAAEEAFVNDLMHYIRGKVRSPELVTGPTDDIFNRIASVLEEQYAAQMDVATGRTLPPEIVDFWDGLFNPEVIRPDDLFDPLTEQVVNTGPTTTKKFRYETDPEFAKRAVKFGKSQGEASLAEFKLQQKAKVRAAAEKNLSQMEMLAKRPDKWSQLSDKLGNRAGGELDKLAQELETNPGAVPAQWQPMMQAMTDMWDEVEKMGPEEAAAAAEILSEIPQTFSEVLKYAAERGFEPTHLPEMTWEKGQKALFGHVKLGKAGRELTAAEADTRKARTGALTASGRTERSIETLAAGLVDATHEMYSGRLIDFIETNYAKPIPPGAGVPEGWVPWDPDKQYLMTGSRPVEGALQTVTGQDTRYIIPREVRQAIDSMSQDYDHWLFRGITRVTSPWKTMLLTLSPKWYTNAFVGNTIAATSEGVKLQDWVSAWKKFKAKDLPREITGRSFASLSMEEGGVGSTLVQRGVRDTLSAEGKRAALHRVRQRLTSLQDNIDNFARTAVYDKTLRTTGSRNAALTRAVEALVDYGDMSPFERHFVRAVVPFYAWQKGVLKLVSRFPADHPMATVALTNLGRVQQEMLEDTFGGEIPEAYEGLVPGLPGGARNLRALNPFLDSAALLSPQGIAANTNPLIDIFLRDALGAPEGGYVDQYEIGPTGTAIPDVDPVQSAWEQIRGLPQIRLGEQTTGSGGDVYQQEPGLGEAVGRFAGAGRTYSEDDITAIQERLAKGKKRVNS